MCDFLLRIYASYIRPIDAARADGRKRLALITTSADASSPQPPLAIHQRTGREDARLNPLQRRVRTASPANDVVLPEDRVSLSGRHPDPRRRPATASDFDLTKEASGERSARSPHISTYKADREASSQAPTFGGKTSASRMDEEVRHLKRRDAEVKAHEHAHMAAGGGLIQGAASYTYEKGPDGAMYAVGGEVKIDASPARTPDQTIRKAQQIRRAALAPAQPSAADHAVAAAASRMEAQARAEKMQASSSGGAAPSPEPSLPEAASPEAKIREADTRSEAGPHTGASSPDTPPDPFTAHTIQVYQASAVAAPAAQAISTFV